MMIAALWRDLEALTPEIASIDVDEASSSTAIQMKNGVELFSEWNSNGLWISGLLGTPHQHWAQEIYETLLAFVADPRKTGGLIIAGSGGGEPLVVIVPVPGAAETLDATELAHAVVRASEITLTLKHYVAAPDAHSLG